MIPIVPQPLYLQLDFCLFPMRPSLSQRCPDARIGLAAGPGDRQLRQCHSHSVAQRLHNMPQQCRVVGTGSGVEGLGVGLLGAKGCWYGMNGGQF
jgi:hypothetical protein